MSEVRWTTKEELEGAQRQWRIERADGASCSYPGRRSQATSGRISSPQPPAREATGFTQHPVTCRRRCTRCHIHIYLSILSSCARLVRLRASHAAAGCAVASLYYSELYGAPHGGNSSKQCIHGLDFCSLCYHRRPRAFHRDASCWSDRRMCRGRVTLFAAATAVAAAMLIWPPQFRRAAAISTVL